MCLAHLVSSLVFESKAEQVESEKKKQNNPNPKPQPFQIFLSTIQDPGQEEKGKWMRFIPSHYVCCTPVSICSWLQSQKSGCQFFV